MALFNAFRYHYPDLTGCSLLVDIGARTTNLLFVEPGKVFSRAFRLAAVRFRRDRKEMSEPLARRSFARSEKDSLIWAARTRNRPILYARMSKIVRGTLTRLHAELMRSISHYRAQQQGTQPQRVFLRWQREHAVHVRVLSREIAVADRVL